MVTIAYFNALRKSVIYKSRHMCNFILQIPRTLLRPR